MLTHGQELPVQKTEDFPVSEKDSLILKTEQSTT